MLDLARYVSSVSRAALGQPEVSDRLGFDVSAHPDARSKVAVDMFNQNEASTASSAMDSKRVTAIPNLKKLNLLGNMIATVEKGALDGLLHCQSINLGENKIETFASGTFTNLNFVKTLLLSGNRIGAVDAGMFKGLTEVQTLDLS